MSLSPEKRRSLLKGHRHTIEGHHHREEWASLIWQWGPSILIPCRSSASSASMGGAQWARGVPRKPAQNSKYLLTPISPPHRHPLSANFGTPSKSLAQNYSLTGSPTDRRIREVASDFVSSVRDRRGKGGDLELARGRHRFGASSSKNQTHVASSVYHSPVCVSVALASQWFAWLPPTCPVPTVVPVRPACHPALSLTDARSPALAGWPPASAGRAADCPCCPVAPTPAGIASKSNR